MLLIALLQLAVGLTLLGIYEGFKTHYFNSTFGDGIPESESKQLVAGERGEAKFRWRASVHSSNRPWHPLAAERAFFFHTPLDYLFWFSAVSSACSLFGLAGIFAAQPTLVTIFFA